MDSIDQIRQNMSEVDMLLNYASQNANDVQIYQLFNKHTERLLDTVVPLNLFSVKTLV